MGDGDGDEVDPGTLRASPSMTAQLLPRAPHSSQQVYGVSRLQIESWKGKDQLQFSTL